MKTKTLEGIVKHTQDGELVAEIAQRDAAFLVVGKSIVEVAGVTGRVRKLGQVFKGRQYAYLADATGNVPTFAPAPYVEVVPQDGGQSELIHAIV